MNTLKWKMLDPKALKCNNKHFQRTKEVNQFAMLYFKMGDWSDDEKTTASAPQVSDYHNASLSINIKNLLSVPRLQKLNKLMIGAAMIDKTIMMIVEITFQEEEKLKNR